MTLREESLEGEKGREMAEDDDGGCRRGTKASNLQPPRQIAPHVIRTASDRLKINERKYISLIGIHMSFGGNRPKKT